MDDLKDSQDALTHNKLVESRLFKEILSDVKNIKYLDENFLISLAHLIFKSWTQDQSEEKPFECLRPILDQINAD